VSDQTGIPRRAFIGWGLAALASTLAGGWLVGRRSGRFSGERPPAETMSTLLSFLGALFGHDLSEADREDLTRRLAEYASSENLKQDCAALARHLDRSAAALGASRFDTSSPLQRERILDEIMLIDPKTFHARLLARLFPGSREHYRMRWSTVPALAWLYRHSAAAWRARGYARWPGVPGDWREITAPGAAYP
jgi:hypothetical protein